MNDSNLPGCSRRMDSYRVATSPTCGVELGHRRSFPARGSYVTGRIDKQATALASTWLSTIIRIDQRRPSTYKDGLGMHQNTITI